MLAATRRLMRSADAPPLGTIRSLAYFLPVIEEVLEVRVSPEYFEYLRYKLARAGLPGRLAPNTTGGHLDRGSDAILALGADDGKANRTPAAWMISPTLPHQPTQQAFCVDDGRDLSLFPVPFSEWVTSTKRHWVTFP